MKTIVINASPRANWNTAMLLQEAVKGAEAAGAETEYVSLYDLDFTGCRSCLACKRENAQRCKCYWNDDLSPLIQRILSADAVIIGSPIYFSEPTAHFRALLERLMFCVLSYDGVKRNYFQGKVNVGLIYTMNCPEDFYTGTYQHMFATHQGLFKEFLNGEVRTYGACNTLQVTDYSKYSMGRFDEPDRLHHRKTQFPLDQKAVFDIARELSQPREV